MIYLISQDWINTSKNHAGMTYLCNTMQKKKPEVFQSVVIPTTFNDSFTSKNRIVRKIQKKILKWKYRFYLNRIYASFHLRESDVVFFMEYMDVNLPIQILARRIKKCNPKIKIFAMSHLVPQKLDKMFRSEHEFLKWISLVDKLFTFGHSLTNYYLSRGVSSDKLVTTLHYVDDFYCCKEIVESRNQISVIAMGNQMRNLSLLCEVVNANANVHFIVCQGMNDLSGIFKDNHNVELIPFVDEECLRNYMSQADISLNVMEDTIGSNVIVTSLAMGLALICSDVGSIRDYCDETNTIFCTEKKHFSMAIKKLSEDRGLLNQMKKSARNTAEKFSIENFMKDIEDLVF